MKTLLVAAILIGLAFVLNPGPDAHRAKLKTEIAARSQLAALLRIGDVAAFASSYHTLGLASYTTINERVVSYGALGLVFVPDFTK